jgi:hypothetical protein
MSKPIQEALHSGTDAIRRGTAEIAFGKKDQPAYRVRLKDLKGYVFHGDFDTMEEALDWIAQKYAASKPEGQ